MRLLGVLMLVCACGSGVTSSDGGTGGGVATGGGTATGGGGPVGTSYFVAPDGDDANAGTIAAPFKTIGHAVSIASADPLGATVLLRAGTWSEKVSISQGTKPLVLAAYAGEAAIIDGTGLTVANGQQGLIDVTRGNVTIDGLELRNFRSTTSAVPLGVFAHGSGDGLTLRRTHIHHIATTVGSCNGTGGNAFGLAIYGTDTTPWTNVVVSENELDHLTLGCSESLSLNGNVDGFEVTKNQVHDNDNIGIVAIGFEGTAPTPALDQARNGRIAENQVWNIASRENPAYAGESSADGIYVDGATRITIERNVVHHADLGVEVASEHQGRSSSWVLVRNNVVFGSVQAGLSLGGYAASVGNADHDVFLNNTLSDNTVELQLQFHVSESVFQNNVVFNAAGDFLAGSANGLTQVANLKKSGAAAMVFITPGSDFHTVAALASQVVDQGAAFSCPAGWACPPVWGAVLTGEFDVAGNARSNGAIDLGAFEQ